MNTDYDDHKRIPLDDGMRYYYTFDLGCCAALVSSGFELASLDKCGSGRVQFIILKTTGLSEALEGYWANTLKVPARTYFDTLKMIKNRLYSF